MFELAPYSTNQSNRYIALPADMEEEIEVIVEVSSRAFSNFKYTQNFDNVEQTDHRFVPQDQKGENNNKDISTNKT